MSASPAHPVLLHRYAKPSSLDSALRLLAADATAMPIAGGTDLVPLTRARLRVASTVVDLGALPMAGARRDGDWLVLGALTTAHQASRDPLVQAHAPLLAQALRAGASAQIRHRATLGGNLLQAPRCPWLRSGSPGCNRRAEGSGCDAQASASPEGDRWLAIFGANAQCAAVVPSDLAVVLQAMRARVELRALHGTRALALDALWCDGAQRPGVPGQPALAHGELITALRIPLAQGRRTLGAFEKVRDRASFEFALVSVALWLHCDGDRIVDAAASAGGVAPAPWRLVGVEDALRGQLWREVDHRVIAAQAARSALARPGNAFKASLLVRTVERALASVRRMA